MSNDESFIYSLTNIYTTQHPIETVIIKSLPLSSPADYSMHAESKNNFEDAYKFGRYARYASLVGIFLAAVALIVFGAVLLFNSDPTTHSCSGC